MIPGQTECPNGLMPFHCFVRLSDDGYNYKVDLLDTFICQAQGDDLSCFGIGSMERFEPLLIDIPLL